jgi:phage terminase small subunit
MIEDIKRLTWKQRRIVNQKISGKTNKQIAIMEYPNSPEHSGEVMVSRVLNKTHVAQYLEQSKMIALKEHNITWSRILKPVSDGLDAGTQIRDKEGNVIDTIPDINTRLRASKQAAEMLRVKEEIDPTDPSGLKLPDGIDEIQLVRLMKK